MATRAHRDFLIASLITPAPSSPSISNRGQPPIAYARLLIVGILLIALLCQTAVSTSSYAEQVGKSRSLTLNSSQPSEKPGLYVADHGFFLVLPANYAAHGQFTDPDKIGEAVLLFPKDIPEEYLFPPDPDEDKFAKPFVSDRFNKFGVIELTATTRKHEGKDAYNLEALREDVLKSLKEANKVFTIEDLSLRMPAFQVTLTEIVPPLIVLGVEGEKNVYMFTTGHDTRRTLLAIIETLHE